MGTKLIRPRPGSPPAPRMSMLLNDSAWRRVPSSSRGLRRHSSPPAPLQPAPVFEGEAGAVGAHSVLPQELLEASLQLRFAGLPLIAPGVAPETVAVENAGVVEARHDCTWCGDKDLEYTGGSARPPLRPDAWVFGSKNEAGVSQLRLRGGGPQMSQDKRLPTLTTPPNANACRPPVVSAPGSGAPLPSLAGLTSLYLNSNEPEETSTTTLSRRVSRGKPDAAFGRSGCCTLIGSPGPRDQRLDRSASSSPASWTRSRSGLAAPRITSGLSTCFRAPFCVPGNLARNF